MEDINTILEKVESAELMSRKSPRDEGTEWTAEEQRDWIAVELRNLTPDGYPALRLAGKRVGHGATLEIRHNRGAGNGLAAARTWMVDRGVAGVRLSH